MRWVGRTVPQPVSWTAVRWADCWVSHLVASWAGHLAGKTAGCWGTKMAVPTDAHSVETKGERWAAMTAFQMAGAKAARWAGNSVCTTVAW